MSESSLQATAIHGIHRNKSFKDKIHDKLQDTYHGVGNQIERTRSIFVDAKQAEAAKKTNLITTQKLIDFRQKQRDYRLAIDHLASEYTLAKETSFFTRYGKMKLMVKRIIMQDSEMSKVNPSSTDSADAGTPNMSRNTNNGSGGQLAQNAEKPAEFVVPPGVNRQHKDIVAKLQKFESMSRLDVQEDTKKMDEELGDIASRLAQVRSAIQRLDEEYSDAKRFAPWDRYMMMKKMIKNFLTCKNALL